MSSSAINMFSMYGAAGFYKAPVSKFLVGSAVVSSFAMMFPLQHHRHLLNSNTHLVLEKNQPWRLITSKLAFLDLKDLILCSMLMYYFRIFERRFGSRKFVSYLLSTSIIATLLEYMVMLLCQHHNFNLDFMPTGPLCCVFPLFVPYYLDIPRVASTYILGVPVTGKTFTYILGFQVASATAESRIAAACGLVAGMLWHQNFLWVQQWLVVPSVVGRLCRGLLGNLLESKPPQGQALPMGATLELQRQEHMDRLERQLMQQYSMQHNHVQNLVPGPGIFSGQGLRQRHGGENGAAGGSPNSPNRTEASEDQIKMLVDMGFNPDRVRHALRVTNNDLTMATNVLLQEG